ncbi:MAG: hypothetical protein Kow0047_24960 [Anaerolineae bacterium]
MIAKFDVDGYANPHTYSHVHAHGHTYADARTRTGVEKLHADHRALNGAPNTDGSSLSCPALLKCRAAE